MGLILFKDNVNKSVADYMWVTLFLRQFVESRQKQLAVLLARSWGDMQNAITYAELRNAIITGALGQGYLKQWREDYAKLINESLSPEWEKAFRASQKEIASKYKDWTIDLTTPEVEKWFSEHGGKLITRLSEDQWKAVNSMIKRAGTYSATSVDGLARTLRPLIGLTGPQTTANMNYYQTMLNNGATEKMAQEASLKYAAIQHRQRAETIAINELAVGYRQGAYQGIKQAQAQGLIGKVKRRWSSAGDDRVCGLCRQLDGKTVGIDEPFRIDGHVIYHGEGAHIRCRCAEVFVEEDE